MGKEFLRSRGWAFFGLNRLALVRWQDSFGHLVHQQADQFWDIRSGEHWLCLGVPGLAF